MKSQEQPIAVSASEEHFERWWKHHGIHRHGAQPLLVESYREVAHSAWQAAFGKIPRAYSDERIERLEERAQYLRMKIFNDRPAESAFKKAELSALEWATTVLRQVT